MEHQTAGLLEGRMREAMQDKSFLQKLNMNRADAAQLFGTADWALLMKNLAPVRERISCEAALEAFRPLLDQLSPALV